MTTKKRQAAVFGATGVVGRHCVQHLLHHPNYARIHVYARRPATLEHARLTWHQLDFDTLPAGISLRGVDDVFCALGTTRRKAGSGEAFRKIDLDLVLTIARTAASHGVERFVVVSAVGADPRSLALYSRTKGEMERSLEGLGFPQLHILRPSLLLGDREESRPLEALGQTLTPLLSPALIGPLRRYRPVQAEEVARSMIALAQRRDRGTHVHHLPLST